ncbi:unknown [Gryllus bimaculatus nudivirus]|uniref:Uncharacterized protein n=1 Tax=Gryllus bimaculatus nudivirus TaxID=432587 RepID=A4L1Z1_9VIRU|nr:hypothetical protein GrBNV_gp28 [Gryllus bimaculatus nudivirus]ABO45361.1 unknown [Gryllus bimaculatus nudivirus]
MKNGKRGGLPIPRKDMTKLRLAKETNGEEDSFEADDGSDEEDGNTSEVEKTSFVDTDADVSTSNSNSNSSNSSSCSSNCSERSESDSGDNDSDRESDNGEENNEPVEKILSLRSRAFKEHVPLYVIQSLKRGKNVNRPLKKNCIKLSAKKFKFQKPFVNTSVIEIKTPDNVLLERLNCVKLFPDGNKVSESRFGQILCSYSEIEENCSDSLIEDYFNKIHYKFKIVNSEDDLSQYPFVYGYVPEKYYEAAMFFQKKITEHSLVYVQKVNDLRKVKNVTSKNTIAFADGQLEAMIFTYAKLFQTDLVEYSETVPRKKAKELLNFFINSIFKKIEKDQNGQDHTKIKYILDLIISHSNFTEKNYYVSKEAIYLLKSYFCDFVNYCNKRDAFMEVQALHNILYYCRVHHYLCPHTFNLVCSTYFTICQKYISEQSIDDDIAIMSEISSNSFFMKIKDNKITYKPSVKTFSREFLNSINLNKKNKSQFFIALDDLLIGACRSFTSFIHDTGISSNGKYITVQNMDGWLKSLQLPTYQVKVASFSFNERLTSEIVMFLGKCVKSIVLSEMKITSRFVDIFKYYMAALVSYSMVSAYAGKKNLEVADLLESIRSFTETFIVKNKYHDICIYDKNSGTVDPDYIPTESEETEVESEMETDDEVDVESEKDIDKLNLIASNMMFETKEKFKFKNPLNEKEIEERLQRISIPISMNERHDQRMNLQLHLMKNIASSKCVLCFSSSTKSKIELEEGKCAVLCCKKCFREISMINCDVKSLVKKINTCRYPPLLFTVKDNKERQIILEDVPEDYLVRNKSLNVYSEYFVSKILKQDKQDPKSRKRKYFTAINSKTLILWKKNPDAQFNEDLTSGHFSKLIDREPLDSEEKQLIFKYFKTMFDYYTAETHILLPYSFHDDIFVNELNGVYDKSKEYFTSKDKIYIFKSDAKKFICVIDLEQNILVYEGCKGEEKNSKYVVNKLSMFLKFLGHTDCTVIENYSLQAGNFFSDCLCFIFDVVKSKKNLSKIIPNTTIMHIVQFLINPKKKYKKIKLS